MYIVLPSIKKPKLFIPHNDNEIVIVNGIKMYTPYSIKGKLIKEMISVNNAYILRKLPFLISNISVLEYSGIYKHLFEKCQNLFNENHIYFNIYLGTSGENQKLTLQINNENGEILGYIKLGNKVGSSNMINKERAALNIVNNKFKTIKTPLLISYGKYNDFSYTIQTGLTNNISYENSNELSKEHLEFLYEAFLIKNDYIQSSVYLMDIATQINKLNGIIDPKSIEILEEGYLYLIDNVNRFVTTYIHGDFAPWNSYLLYNKKLYVFDWEYFSEDGPIFYDLFHYLIQLEILVKKNNYKKIINNITKNPLLIEYSRTIKNDQVKEYLVLYLIKSALDLIQENNLKGLEVYSNKFINIRLAMIRYFVSELK
ncbi:hypothetical protein GTHT12_02837 [Geobacillus thermodenitrificans]|nr:hypothetical protein GTHT12_02837 [Geobacillus thermodenitrificans]